jgi:hypothetical protein
MATAEAIQVIVWTGKIASAEIWVLAAACFVWTLVSHTIISSFRARQVILVEVF